MVPKDGMDSPPSLLLLPVNIVRSHVSVLGQAGKDEGGEGAEEVGTNV